MRTLATVAVLSAVILSACSGTSATVVPGATQQAQPTAPAKTAAPATDEPLAGEPTDTPAPATETSTYLPGQPVTLTNNGADWATIVVSNVAAKTGYGSYDRPAKGNVYVQALITYTALQDGVDYNPFDWQVFVDGTAVENYGFVVDGPKPTLSSGTLPKGRKASGYVVYEVPAKGEVLLSYQGNMFSNDAPVFEVKLRSK